MRGKYPTYNEAEITRLRQEGAILLEKISTLRRMLNEKSELVTDPDKLLQQIEKAERQVEAKTQKIEVLLNKRKAE